MKTYKRIDVTDLLRVSRENNNRFVRDGGFPRGFRHKQHNYVPVNQVHEYFARHNESHVVSEFIPWLQTKLKTYEI